MEQTPEQIKRQDLMKQIGEILIEADLTHVEELGILEAVKGFVLWEYQKEMEKRT